MEPVIFMSVRHPWTTFEVNPGQIQYDKISGRELPNPPIGRKLAKFYNGMYQTTDEEVIAFLDGQDKNGIYRADNPMVTYLLMNDAASLDLANREPLQSLNEATVSQMLQTAKDMKAAGISSPAMFPILPSLATEKEE